MARRPVPTDAASLENAALNYLQRFATSSENLRRVLRRRCERAWRLTPPDDAATARAAATAAIETVIGQLAGAGLLDDAAYAAAKAGSLQRRGVAMARIRHRLAGRGIDPATATAALAGLAADHPDPDLAAALGHARRRRLGPFRPAAGRAAHRDRDLAALGRAGFSYAIAVRVIDMPAEE